VLASGIQDCGFEPGRSRRIFRAKKSSAVCPTSQICGMLKTPGNYCGIHICRQNLSAISRPFPFLATRGLSRRLTWSASGVDGRNYKRCTKDLLAYGLGATVTAIPVCQSTSTVCCMFRLPSAFLCDSFF
jgi:hypothetical protein